MKKLTLLLMILTILGCSVASEAISPTATDAPDPTDAPTDESTPTTPANPTAVSTATAGERTGDPAAVTLQADDIAAGFQRPTDIVADGSGRLFIVEQPGLIHIIDADNQRLDTPFLDIASQVSRDGNERGLLGLAFHPNYAENGQFFVNYTRVPDGTSIVSRFIVNPDDPNQADPGSEVVLLSVEQPAANHNGGELQFGPEGYLYIALGDGGASDDRFDNSQDLSTLLGTILRIDVDNGDPYAIPPDNPFLTNPTARDEIYAYGLRNPWRFSFDSATGDLWIADVGQNLYEEVNYQPAAERGGTNYGWPIMEGMHCFQSETCDQSGLHMPVAEYSRDEGCSVTGGYVYRGENIPVLQGVYVFADYCTGTIWGLWQADDGTWQRTDYLQIDTVSAFGVDEAGELYAANHSSGLIFRLTQ